MVCPPTVTLPVLVLDSDLKGSNFPVALGLSVDDSLSEELVDAGGSARTSTDRNAKTAAASSVPYRIAFACGLTCARLFAFDRPIAVHRLIKLSLVRGAPIIRGRGH